MIKKYLILAMVILLGACQPASEVKVYTCVDNTMHKDGRVTITCDDDNECFYDSSQIKMNPVKFKEVSSEYN